MNLLMVSAYLPGLSSTAGERNYHLLRALVHQHTVSLLSMADRAEVEAYDVRPLLEELVDSVQLIPYEIPHFKRLAAVAERSSWQVVYS